MKRVFILRHAKSSWAQPGISDHDRPLNRRGKSALPLIANAMKDRGYVPDTVYCSTALRTRMTLEGVSEAFPEIQATFDDTLYAAPAEVFLSVLQNSQNGESVLITAHNPACDDFVRMFCAGTGEAMNKFTQKHFPTGALAAVEINADSWEQLSWGSGYLVDFITPRELAG